MPPFHGGFWQDFCVKLKPHLFAFPLTVSSWREQLEQQDWCDFTSCLKLLVCTVKLLLNKLSVFLSIYDQLPEGLFSLCCSLQLGNDGSFTLGHTKLRREDPLIVHCSSSIKLCMFLHVLIFAFGNSITLIPFSQAAVLCFVALPNSVLCLKDLAFLSCLCHTVTTL